MIAVLHYGLDEYSISFCEETDLSTFWEWMFAIKSDGKRVTAFCRKGERGERFVEFCRRYTDRIERISPEDEGDSLPDVRRFVGEIFYSALRSPARYVLTVSPRAIREGVERLTLDREITMTLSDDGSIETVDIDDEIGSTDTIAVCEKMIAIWKEWKEAVDERQRALPR